MTDIALTLCVSLLIQAVFFAFAATMRTDKVTDLSYGLSFVIIVGMLAWRHRPTSPAEMAVAAMVALWGIRLSGYLLYRIVRIGRDTRFDGIREHFWPFFKFWLGQGLAVWVIMLPVTIWFGRSGEWTTWMSVGAVVWGAGLTIETIADAQKFAAKNRPDGRNRWMTTGLWKFSRHPNYFGELLCWWGLFVCVAGDYAGWSWLGLVGPLTITLLLLKVTGIPTLEATANKKWGDNPDYLRHVRRTNRLIPWPPRSNA